MSELKTIGQEIAEHISIVEILSTETARVVEPIKNGIYRVSLHLCGFNDKELAELVVDQINSRLKVCSLTVIERAKEILNRASSDILK